MPPIRKQALCEIIFGQMRIPVSEKEKGKQVIEGIFMIGEPGKAETKTKARKRAKKAKSSKATPKQPKSKPASKEKALGLAPRQIRSLRKKIGLSQKELADQVEVSRATVSMWEAGKFKPSEEKVRQLASLAGKSKEEAKKMIAGKMPRKRQGKKPRKPKTRRQRRGQAQAVNAQEVNAQVGNAQVGS